MKRWYETGLHPFLWEDCMRQDCIHFYGKIVWGRTASIFMTRWHETGLHPFLWQDGMRPVLYIGMYIHIYTHIYVHIYTSQKECLHIFVCVCVDTPNFQRGGYPIWMLTMPSHFPLFLKVAAWSLGSVSDVPTVGQRHCWLGGKASKCRFTHSWTRTMWAHCGTNTNTINPLMGKQERWRKLCKCTACCFRITKVLKFDATLE